jgi:hypothetical protein
LPARSFLCPGTRPQFLANADECRGIGVRIGVISLNCWPGSERVPIRIARPKEAEDRGEPVRSGPATPAGRRRWQSIAWPRPLASRRQPSQPQADDHLASAERPALLARIEEEVDRKRFPDTVSAFAAESAVADRRSLIPLEVGKYRPPVADPASPAPGSFPRPRGAPVPEPAPVPDLQRDRPASPAPVPPPSGATAVAPPSLSFPLAERLGVQASAVLGLVQKLADIQKTVFGLSQSICDRAKPMPRPPSIPSSRAAPP